LLLTDGKRRRRDAERARDFAHGQGAHGIAALDADNREPSDASSLSEVFLG
jgi:hypothetical protein